MKRKLIPIAGLAGLALSGWSAHAQVFNYTAGDLILDFSASGKSDLEIDIGSLANLNLAAAANSGSYTLSGTDYNISSQLIATFGSVDNLSFSVFGLDPTATTVWLTQEQTGASPNTAPNNVSGSKQGGLVGTVQSIVGIGNSTGILPWSGFVPSSSVTNSANVAIIPTAGAEAPNSYTAKGPAGWSANAPSSPPVANTTSALFDEGGSITSDLYAYGAGGIHTQTSYAGQFTFNSDGSLVFDPVPEPSTYALVAVGGMLFLPLRNRVRHKQA